MFIIILHKDYVHSHIARTYINPIKQDIEITTVPQNIMLKIQGGRISNTIDIGFLQIDTSTSIHIYTSQTVIAYLPIGNILPKPCQL